MNPDKSGEQFLHSKDSKLHTTPPVEHEIARMQRAQAHAPKEERSAVSHKPADKLAAFMHVLERTHQGSGASERRRAAQPQVLERIKQSYHRDFVIQPHNIPESVFELEARIAREQGHGNVELTPEYRQAKTQEILTNQAASLDKWVDYLTSDDALYPMWAKYWAFKAVTQMGKFEKKITTDAEGHEHEIARFARRDEHTAAPFAPLNPRALALAIGVMQERLAQKGVPKAEREPLDNVSTKLSDEAFAQLATTESFSKLYTQFLIELPEYSAEGLQEVRGQWHKYPQGSDPKPLVDSLEGYPLEWCTANIDTAASQLRGGDFYVYYSLDQSGEATIPRVAIRMQDDHIAEVRGITADQNIDPYIAPVVTEKMAEFEDGQRYTKRAEDMRRLTEIEQTPKDNPNTALTRDQIKFLYEIESPIEGFGYARDPRIAELREARGTIDHAELQALAVEILREKFEASYQAYHTVTQQLNDQRVPHEHIPLLTAEHVSNLFEAKLGEWESRGVLDWVRDKIITDGSVHTLVITTNAPARPAEILSLATTFGQAQPYDTHTDTELYQQYSAQELSGTTNSTDPLTMSLIPSKYTTELGRDDVATQRATLQDLQTQQPSLGLAVPSVLNALSYWQTLRAGGNSLDTDSAHNTTYIRHFDLADKRLEGNRFVPSLLRQLLR